MNEREINSTINYLKSLQALYAYKQAILKNNLYMLRLIWQACPSGVICEMIHSLIHRFSELFYSVFCSYFYLSPFLCDYLRRSIV